MARFSHGINGPFQGNIGTVEGATWKGIPYIRARRRKRTSSASDKEKASRSKFAMAHQWLQPLLNFVRQGFKGDSPTVEGFNAAKSYLLRNAFELNGDQMVINPAKVQVSKGTLPLPDDLVAETIEGNQLQVTWNTAYKEGTSYYDQVMLLAYNIEKRKVEMKITGQFRNAGLETLSLEANSEYHVYVAFVADDRSRQSDSVYMGTVRS